MGSLAVAWPCWKASRARRKTALGCCRDMQLIETKVGLARPWQVVAAAAQVWRATSCTVKDLPAAEQGLLDRQMWAGGDCTTLRAFRPLLPAR